MVESRVPLERRLRQIASSFRGSLDNRDFQYFALLLLVFRGLASRCNPGDCQIPTWQALLSDPTGRLLSEYEHAWQQVLAEGGSYDPFARDAISLAIRNRPSYLNTQSLLDLIDWEVSQTSVPEVSDRLFEYVRDQGGVQSGQHMSPPCLRSLVAQIVSPGAATNIYDPACGTGSLIVDVARRSTLDDPTSRLLLSGQEVDRRTAVLAQMNLFLHGFRPSGIRCGNTLTEPAHTDHGILRRFDVVASVLPLGMRMPKAQRESLSSDLYGRYEVMPGAAVEGAFVQHVSACLAEGGTAVVALSSGFLFRSGAERVLREELVRTGTVIAVISLPAIFRRTSVRPALIVLQKRTQEDSSDGILFVSAENVHASESGERALSPGEIREIVSLVQGREAREGLSALVASSMVVANDALLAPGSYTAKMGKALILGSEAQEIRLGDIAVIDRGTQVKTTKVAMGGPPVIRAGDLRQPILSPDDLAEVSAGVESQSLPRVETGDILIQRSGEHPTSFLVEEAVSGAVFSDSVIRVGLDNSHRHLAAFVVDYLNSDLGQTELLRCGHGAATRSLQVPLLEELAIPLPDRDVIRLANGLREVENELIERVARARHIRERVFGVQEQDDAMERLASLSVEQQALAASLLRVDDLSFRIRNFYPYPLSFPYRMLESMSETAEQYRAQLQLAESFLAFFGNLGLALLAHDQQPLGEGSHPLSVESLCQYWQGGISPGDWQCIARETARMLQSLTDDALSASFSAIWFKGKGKGESDFAANTRILIELKNDFKHDRGPKTPPDFEQAVSRLQEILDSCFERIGFLVRHPLYLTEPPTVDPLDKSVTMPVLNCSGDHPAFVREAHHHEKPLPANTLFIASSAEDWVRLFPVLTAQYCPTCKNRELFFVDRWDGPGKRVVLRSLERGHTMDSKSEDARVSRDARRIGEYLEKWLADVRANREGKDTEE